ncbi:MAG: VWA domain-containing protein [Clostridia bacterium]|nr:VWA domain-containing protein [Clostridia bacterium]
MKNKPSVFDIEQQLKRSVPQPSAAQKDQILEKLAQTEQLSPDATFPVAPTPKRRNAWKLATSCCMLALVLVGATAWFGRGWFGETADEAAPESPFYEAFKDVLTDGESIELTTGAVSTTPTYAMTAATTAAMSAAVPEGTMAPILGEMEMPADEADMDFSAEGAPAEDWVVDSKKPIPGEVTQPQPAAGLLTAGEWCDNADYAFFTNLFEDERWAAYVERYGLKPVERYVVTVADENGAPAKNVRVALTDAQGNTLCSAVTDYSGTAYLFAMSEAAAANAVAITAEGESTPITTDENGTLGASLILGGNVANVLDLMFVVDTTGSMADELAYLQAELRDVIAQVKNQNPNLTIRLSINFYRDEGDTYVVLPMDFTTDIGAALATLAAQFADGGGDEPEAVHTALENAIFDHEWSENSVKLLYFVLDAPAHSENVAVLDSLRQTLPCFAAEGVRIIPVAASGVAAEAEYFLRTCATLTGGTYTFLTNHSGIGNAHAEPMIGQYTVRPLNELLVEITTRYCR